MFRDDFMWGAATAAFQIEGGADERGQTVWDEFCRRPGKVYEGQDGTVACDHYGRLEGDLDLMANLGLKGYRFSIAWARVLPNGVGEVNEKGLAFYERLVDGLLHRNITPVATLFHWDYPLELFRKGGWLNRETVRWFADYTRVVVDRLSDRVTHWVTLNEPQCFINLGHGSAIHAPGLKLSIGEQLLATHHALMAHGEAVRVIREHAKKPPLVSFAPIAQVKTPATGSEADIKAAMKGMASVQSHDIWNNTWFADPVMLGHYPEEGLRVYGDAVPKHDAVDLELISQPVDFLGINCYWGGIVKAGASGEPVEVKRERGHPQTAFRWAVHPESIEWACRFMHERYGKGILITENGLSNIDFPDAEGRVNDPQRIAFTTAYLHALHKAVEAGVDVIGYLHWSLMDNFEWAEGYKERFGLTYVDYETLERTPKASSAWYRELIACNGGSLFR